MLPGRSLLPSLFVFLAAAPALVVAQAKHPPERWDGVVVYDSLKVPFSMQIDWSGASVSAVFTSGEERVKSTGGTHSGDTIRISFDTIGSVLEAVQNGGTIKGTYTRKADGKRLPVELNRFCTCGFVGEGGPDISGVWSVEGGGRLTVQRNDDDTFATLKLAGDDREFGSLSGRFDGVSFTLSHFIGTTAALLEVEPRKDGRLDLKLQLPCETDRKLVASRN